jgi:hypothetical protein
MSELPDDLRDLDRMLQGVRFQPRASLGAEIAGRFARGDRPTPRGPRFTRSQRMGGVGGMLVLALAACWLIVVQPLSQLTVDHCCQDLDGGGDADDGVQVISHKGTDVRYLTVYEDLDHSGSFTPGDRVRYTRDAGPVLNGPIHPNARTVELCCLDYDGGGPADDALMIVNFPPDRITMAAIIERGGNQRQPAPLR